MFKLIQRLLNSRIWALAIKEVQQILRSKKLLFMLVFPPTVQLLLYGLILNPDVQYLKLGIVDQANVAASRELVAALTENEVFVADRYSPNQQVLGEQVRQGEVTVGLVFPPEFNRNLSQGKPAEIQVMVDGVDANTAGIASGYITQIVRQYSRQLAEVETANLVEPQITFLYNPG